MSTVRETGVSLWTFYSLGASPSFANTKCTYKSRVCVVQYYEKCCYKSRACHGNKRGRLQLRGYECHAKNTEPFMYKSSDASTVFSDTDTRRRRFRCFHLRLPEHARAPPSLSTRAAAAHEGQ